ncbi:hypothetical protein LKO27_06070 [Tessaracoccus sp. OS52]|uniref:hypothetical protein n=1 Tax=Tessaracoccus sp. OS52 TaxID=2886691 RepID=UPI001D0F831F|nr:hypothetical protein [Tessaracoccus sp. OS52]MCC2592978.1 hypothetical protein [Tessaracoccus sp. OS52]
MISVKNTVFAITVLCLLGGCTSSLRETDPRAVPTSQTSGLLVEAVIQVDGPWYADISELAAAADLVVQVRVEASEATLSYPDESSYSSDDPFLNPYAGTGRTPSAAELEAMASPATVNTAVVLDVVAGSAEVGDVVRVWEHGDISNLARLAGDPLLFLESSGSDEYWVVGTYQGAFAPSGNAEFVSVAEDREDLLFQPGDRTLVDELLGSS